MKKKLVLGLILASTLFVGCGNYDLIDTTWSYDKAIINLGDREIEVEIESWINYKDTSIQIKTKDGKVYLTDIKNVLMIKE